MKKIIVLGCTGSIGSQTLDIVRHSGGDFKVVGLSAGHNRTRLDSLCEEFDCKGTLFEHDGMAGIRNLVESSGADMAVNGIAGAAGLEPSAIVLEQGINLALANKETVVMAWPVIKALAQQHNASIVPVDSEHSAVFSLINQIGRKSIKEIIITASGGPFRMMSDEELKIVTVEQALKHPTWNMGKKITVDSASLANKGLEVIEACRLFDISPEAVKVVVHPQSLVHSLVRTNDGMLYGQISNPDMRHPIVSALRWPENTENYLPPFDLAGHEMSFYPPRFDSFPLLKAAYECAAKGNSYTIAFNAANEIAAWAFIDKKCSFPSIYTIVQGTLNKDWTARADSLEAIFEQDKKARDVALDILNRGNL